MIAKIVLENNENSIYFFISLVNFDQLSCDSCSHSTRILQLKNSDIYTHFPAISHILGRLIKIYPQPSSARKIGAKKRPAEEIAR